MAFLNLDNAGFGLGANNPFKNPRGLGGTPIGSPIGIPLGGPSPFGPTLGANPLGFERGFSDFRANPINTPIRNIGSGISLGGNSFSGNSFSGNNPIGDFNNINTNPIPTDPRLVGGGTNFVPIEEPPFPDDITIGDVPPLEPEEIEEILVNDDVTENQIKEILNTGGRTDRNVRVVNPIRDSARPRGRDGSTNNFKPPTPPPPPPSPPKPPRDGAPDPKDPARVPSRSRIYTKFDMVDDVIKNTVQVNTKGIWQNGSGSLSTYYTGSNTSTQKQYYYTVYNGTPSDCQYGRQFDVAYGHYFGSGSSSGGGQTNDSPTRAVYSQFKNITQANPTVESKFNFTGTNTDQVYVVLFNRSRMEDRVDPGNWEINLAQLNGADHPNQYYTGSNVTVDSSNTVYRFIDDSGDSDETNAIANAYLGGLTYNIVSGSVSNGKFSNDSWGKFYPDLGMLIFDGDKLDTNLGFNSMTSSNADGENAYKLFKSISGSAVINSNYTFDARSSDVETTTHYFVRVRANEYNFTNNPTFVTGTLGDFRQRTFEQNPRTYITSVGLYNNRNELLAVAKMSKPILKSFTNEALVTVKLKY